jgi:hypothetical protein
MIYAASKSKHASLWRGYRERFPISSSWIDEAEPGQTHDKAEFWSRCIREVLECYVLILYLEVGELQKGALVEVGAALATGVYVFVVGPLDHTWIEHPLVARADSLEQAFERAMKIVSSNVEID